MQYSEHIFQGNLFQNESIRSVKGNELFQMSTAALAGCMRRIVVNGYELDKLDGLSARNMMNRLKWQTCADGGDIDMCSGGICVVDEDDRKCICTDGFDALNCSEG